MQVTDALTAVLADIGDDAVAVFQFCGLGDLRNGREHGGNAGGGVRRDLVGRGNVGLGNDENVDGRLRRDVVKSIDVFVLIDFLGGDDPCNDLAKQAIVHDISPLCATTLARRRNL